jgi:hypothetical protein
MKIFKENKKKGLKCGINNYGELFLGDDKSGYNLRNTRRNRKRIRKDFKRCSLENVTFHGFQKNFVIEVIK